MTHRGMIKDGIYDEIADMSSMLRNKASDLGIPLEAKAINDFSAEEMINAVQLIGHMYAENPAQAETFALKDLDLPVDALKPVIQTFKNLCFTRETQTTTVFDVHKIIPEKVTLPVGLLLANSILSQQHAILGTIVGKPTEEEKLYEITTTN